MQPKATSAAPYGNGRPAESRVVLKEGGGKMASVKDLTIDDLEHLIEQKVLEMLGDPDSGLELREEFKKELVERLAKPSKRVSQQEVLNRFGQD